MAVTTADPGSEEFLRDAVRVCRSGDFQQLYFSDHLDTPLERLQLLTPLVLSDDYVRENSTFSSPAARLTCQGGEATVEHRISDGRLDVKHLGRKDARMVGNSRIAFIQPAESGRKIRRVFAVTSAPVLNSQLGLETLEAYSRLFPTSDVFLYLRRDDCFFFDKFPAGFPFAPRRCDQFAFGTESLLCSKVNGPGCGTIQYSRK
jgi:hypothetical protein